MIDSKTLQCVLALGNALLAVLLLLVAKRDHPSTALRFLSCGKTIQVVAWTMSLWVVDSWFMLTLLLLLGGLAFDAAALWENNDVSRWRQPLGWFWLAMVLWISLIAILGWRWGAIMLFVAFAMVQALAAWAWISNWHNATQLRRTLALVAALLAMVLLTPGLDIVFSGSLFAEQIDGAGAIQKLLASELPFVVLMLINGFGFLLLEREQQQAQLLHLALVDSLTDAPNRRSFLNALNPWLALARRPGQSTALLILDLDHFKRINDNYGHAVGDQVLKAVVQIGMTQLRDSDMIGRLGGEEFAVLLPRTSLDDAMMVAERMRQAIMALQIKTEKAMLNVTASIGVTLIQADDTVISLIKRANEAMEAAKNAGRNCVMQGNPAAGLMVS